MTEQNTVIAGALLGAVVGTAVSYMYFTENGRRFRELAERNLDELAREAEKLMSAVDQVRQGVAELRAGETTGTGWARSA